MGVAQALLLTDILATDRSPRGKPVILGMVQGSKSLL
jgi:hypothetical protein